LILWKFCSRGTIQDIIYNKTMVLDEKFHAAFVRDITLGLEYLHSSPIGYHGSVFRFLVNMIRIIFSWLRGHA
jgi:serine/threonine protein kinase